MCVIESGESNGRERGGDGENCGDWTWAKEGFSSSERSINEAESITIPASASGLPLLPLTLSFPLLLYPPPSPAGQSPTYDRVSIGLGGDECLRRVSMESADRVVAGDAQVGR